MDNAIKAIIAESGDNFGKLLAAGLSAEGIGVSVCSKGGSELAEVIAREEADAVIIVDKGNGSEISEFISACHERVHKTFFIVISEGCNEFREMLGGCSCVITHPVDAKQISRIIVSAYIRRCGDTGRDDVEKYAAAMLCESGVIANLRGTCYLARALSAAVNDSGQSCDICGVYEAVAREFGKTAASVERAVRIAVRLAWDRGDRELMSKAFGDIPANSRFIEYFSDKLCARIIRDGIPSVVDSEQ
ncbi:MAG: sporulation initiation factor Spo0A C-terminal domain-containing protein [Oscillospiraceae bacterium]|nr:sporulation initiation factor Spo0A C-terminal domain-containing protein [Oscillospiraceae bacterium]